MKNKIAILAETHNMNIGEVSGRVTRELMRTERKLNAEMAISEDLRYHDKVARLTAHCDYLRQALAELAEMGA